MTALDPSGRIVSTTCFALLIASAVAREPCSTELYPIHALPTPHSQASLLVDATRGYDGGLHVVYGSADSPLHHLVTYNRGDTWSAPALIDTSSGGIQAGPRLFIHNHDLVALWIAADTLSLAWGSPEGSWRSHRLPIAASRLNAHVDDTTLRVVLSDVYTLRSTISTDFGRTWKDPDTVCVFSTPLLSPKTPAITRWRQATYVAWPEGTSLFVADYVDSRGWSAPQTIDITREHLDPIYQQPCPIQVTEMVATADSLFLFFEERGVFMQALARIADRWSPPIAISQRTATTLSASLGPNNSSIVVWCDSRYQRCDWWGWFPGALAWGDPYWPNNDLFLTTVSTEHHDVPQPIRLTPPLSQCSATPPALVVDSIGTWAFWSGRLSISKHPTDQAVQLLGRYASPTP